MAWGQANGLSRAQGQRTKALGLADKREINARGAQAQAKARLARKRRLPGSRFIAHRLATAGVDSSVQSSKISELALRSIAAWKGASTKPSSIGLRRIVSLLLVLSPLTTFRP